MATYTFNKDGTISEVPEHVPFDVTRYDYGSGASIYDGRGKSQHHHEKQKNTTNLTYPMNIDKFIDALINKYAEYGMSISEDTVNKLLPRLPEDLKDTFLQKVAKHNEYIKTISEGRRRRIASKKLQEWNEQKIKKVKGKNKSVINSKPIKKAKASPNKSKTFDSRILNELNEIRRKSSELMKDMLKFVQETGTSAQVGNFKVSKLKK